MARVMVSILATPPNWVALVTLVPGTSVVRILVRWLTKSVENTPSKGALMVRASNCSCRVSIVSCCWS
ncbi:hypothetical protein D3C75_1220570 [compost metagenome]